MIRTEPTAPPEPPSGSPVRRGRVVAPEPGVEDPEAPVGRLRGAEVEVDWRRVVPFVVGAVLVGLVVATVAMTVAGVRKNDQISALHQQGVVVDATVSSCIGLMGGSGSNLVGYDCRASFTLDGQRYDEPLVGGATPVPGAHVRAVTVPGDPSLFATVGTVAGERASWRVFLVPAALALVLVLFVLLLVRHRRRGAISRASLAANGPR